MDVAISGSTGLIGTALRGALEERGDRVVPLVRERSAKADGDGTGVRWDPREGTVDAAALSGIDAVVHLAGAPIARWPWTADHKRRILESRSRGTRAVAEALASLDDPPRVLLSASGINVYGDTADDVVDEHSERGTGFLADVCHAWEAATAPAEEAGIRVVHLRSGLVLSGEGGLVPRMVLPFRLGVGARFGSGDQWMSWVAIDDHVAALLHLLDRDDLAGPFNLSAPEPVRHREFMKTVGRVMRRPLVVPVPAFALKAAVGPELARETLLVSIRIAPRRLHDSGFEFEYPTLEPALRAALDR